MKLSVYFANRPNMGDRLNVDLIEKYFGYQVKRSTYLTGKVAAIGSGLGNYTYEEETWKNILKAASGIFFPEVYIWGMGFVRYKDNDSKFYKRNTHICALRGELSRKRVEKIMGKPVDVPLADAGILADGLLDSVPEKKYSMGIIAHYKEQDHPVFAELQKRPDSIFIDVRKAPIDVIRDIAACRTVLSSSLHGLIIADSLHIPNHHLKVTDRLLGDGFKFDDYYSAYGLSHEYTDAAAGHIPTPDEIIDGYRIDPDQVDRKKEELLKAFPFPSQL